MSAWISNTTETALFVTSVFLFATALIGAKWFTETPHWAAKTAGVACLALAVTSLTASVLVGEYRTEENQQVLTSVFHDEGYAVTSPLPADEIRPGAYLQGIAATDAAKQPKICVTVISENPSDTTIDCR